MTSLRQRMLEDMQVRRLSACTQRTYVETVARFARYFDRSPARLGPEDARQAGEEDRRRRGAPVQRPPGNGVAATPADLDRVFYRTFGSIAPQAPNPEQWVFTPENRRTEPSRQPQEFCKWLRYLPLFTRQDRPRRGRDRAADGASNGGRRGVLPREARRAARSRRASGPPGCSPGTGGPPEIEGGARRGRSGVSDLAAVLATCHRPRRRGRGGESEEVALEDLCHLLGEPMPAEGFTRQDRPRRVPQSRLKPAALRYSNVSSIVGIGGMKTTQTSRPRVSSTL